MQLFIRLSAAFVAIALLVSWLTSYHAALGIFLAGGHFAEDGKGVNIELVHSSNSVHRNVKAIIWDIGIRQNCGGMIVRYKYQEMPLGPGWPHRHDNENIILATTNHRSGIDIRYVDDHGRHYPLLRGSEAPAYWIRFASNKRAGDDESTIIIPHWLLILFFGGVAILMRKKVSLPGG